MTRRSTLTLLACLGIGLMAACGGPTPTAPPTAAPSQPIATAPSLGENAPASVRDRPLLPPCGLERALRLDGPWNELARECFRTAYEQNQPAEFISTRLTIEGDPITYVYRILGFQRFEIFVDSTRDRFGAQAWTRLDCRSLNVQAGFNPQWVFESNATCTETTIQ